MDRTVVTLTLPEPLLRAAQLVARDSGLTLDGLVIRAIEAELRRAASPAKTPNRADERLLASLRRLLARDLAVARDWDDLARRFAVKGFELREAGGGLAVWSHPGGRRQCKASELGQSYGDLMRRFGRPFPGHSHAWLARRLLGPVATAAKDDGTVIEPFR